MTASLFDRLGGEKGIRAIASDLVDRHITNPAISPRFSGSDHESMKNAAASFFITGTGGPECYEGADMLTAHKGMNISADEFMAVLDDALASLEQNNVCQREQEEVLYTLYSMRKEILAV